MKDLAANAPFLPRPALQMRSRYRAQLSAQCVKVDRPIPLDFLAIERLQVRPLRDRQGDQRQRAKLSQQAVHGAMYLRR
jgi:hypothetical protein